MINIYIICFNNGYYVQNTINQLLKKNMTPPISLDRITVIDNNSTGKETIEILNNLKCNIIRLDTNQGHMVWLHNKEVWDKISEYFVITDPDLEFNENLPDNFLDIMKEISDKYGAGRVGFALKIEDEPLYTFSDYFDFKSIKEWESNFWENVMEKYKDIDLYVAPIDTTFFLGCKNRLHNLNIRVGSNFTAKHLPFYPDHNLSLGKERLLEMYGESKCSTISKFIFRHLEELEKNNQIN